MNEKSKYILKPVFLADHEREYKIIKDDVEIGELHYYPRFKDARLFLPYGELYINEKNCEEMLNKIKENEVRDLIREILKKFGICP
mgnify:CR=1 FL=1